MATKKLQKHLIQLGEQILPSLREEKVNVERKLRDLEVLSSVTLGLYDETDKLCKKAPSEAITELGLEHVNDVIKEARALGGHDPYIKKLKEFVAAGDRPELRDVLMVLRLVRQGLERTTGDLNRRLEQAVALIKDADGLETVISWIDEGSDTDQLTRNVLSSHGVHVDGHWMKYDEQRDVWVFDLDAVNEHAMSERLTLPPL